MTQPLRLPEFLKRPARLVRDGRLTNAPISALGRLLPEPLKSRAMTRAPRIGKASARLPNGRTMRLECDQYEFVLNAVFYNGWTAQEPESLPLWFRYCRRAETVIDVGAHIGLYAIVAALANPKARVHAFEPLPRVADLLRRNIDLNRIDVEVHQLALGRQEADATLYAVAGTIPSASSLSAEYLDLEPQLDWAGVEVHVATLDSILPHAEGPAVMKIDTETTEPDVLAGARRFLERLRPALFIEVLPRDGIAARLHAELEGLDYTAHKLTTTGPIPTDRIDPDPTWPNWLLLPKNWTL